MPPRQERIPPILARLEEAYPDAHCALTHKGPLQLLVATILSAQCTDERVNKVTPPLFRRFPTARAFARARRGDLEGLVRSTGFYRNKARAIQEASKRIVQEFGGKVPRRMEELLTLSGVARKTANVVLGVAYGIPAGIVVDTHVKRIAYRLGLCRSTDPVRVERILCKVIPRGSWIDLSHRLIFHGRRVCKARRPLCNGCPVEDLCPRWGLTPERRRGESGSMRRK